MPADLGLQQSGIAPVLSDALLQSIMLQNARSKHSGLAASGVVCIKSRFPRTEGNALVYQYLLLPTFQGTEML